MEVTGIVVKVFDTYKVSEALSKREIVVDVTDNPKHPQPITFTVLQGNKSITKCDMLDGYKEGDNVTLSFNLRGRESAHRENKYFNVLELWHITKNK